MVVLGNGKKLLCAARENFLGFSPTYLTRSGKVSSSGARWPIFGWKICESGSNWHAEFKLRVSGAEFRWKMAPRSWKRWRKIAVKNWASIPGSVGGVGSW